MVHWDDKQNWQTTSLIKKKREKNKINKIRNAKKRGTDNGDIQKIIRDYHRQRYANKMDNLEEMERFLEKLKLPKLNQEDTEIINKPITSTEIKTVIKKKKLPKNKSPGPDGFTGVICQIFREELMPILQKLFQNIISFLSLSFALPHSKDIGLPLWKSGIFCQCSERVCRSCSICRWIFDVSVGRRVTYSSTVLEVISLVQF